MSKRALVVHTGGGLGDVLLAGPVIDTLSSRGYQVDFLARKGTAPAVASHPQLGELLTIDSKDPSDFRQVRRWAKRIREGAYDAALLLWSTTRWAWTLYLAGVPARVGQDSRLLYSFLFTHKVRIRSEHGDESTHWTDILLDYPRALGLEPGTVEVGFPAAAGSAEQAESLLGQGEFGGLDGPLLGFHSGKGLPLGPERWPVEHFARLAEHLQESLGARLVMTGGPGEVSLVEAIVARLKQPVLNLAGKTDLPTLGAVAAQCQVFVCPDSGPMHIAAAVGTPVVGIYALDEDFPQRWAPFGVPHRVIRPPRPACRPGCKKPTCPDFVCYHKVTPESIGAAVRELLSTE